MELFVDVAPGHRLWAEEIPGPTPGSEVVLLVMGANVSGVAWPDAFVARLAEHHRVIRYDHRDTGRSNHAFDDHPYAIAELAEDAIAVLDAFDVDRAHVVGMSMGGILVQLLLLDHPDRLLTATVFCTPALEAPGSDVAGAPADADELPGPDLRLLRIWQEMGDERDRQGELDWRVEHWRLLNGAGTPFDAEEFRALEERVMAHSGRTENAFAHPLGHPGGLGRGAELAGVEVPTLVAEAPEDPVYPPPHAARLAQAIGGAELVRVPGMGHALGATVVEPLAAAILAHTTQRIRAARPTSSRATGIRNGEQDT